MLAVSWIASGQAGWSLWLVVLGVIVLDFAVQAAHVSNQALLTAAYSGTTSTVIGGYMTFYSAGSAVGAAATTAVHAASGWTGSALLGAGFALGGLLTWSIGRRTVTRKRGDDAAQQDARGRSRTA
jgi:MFS family permease